MKDKSRIDRMLSKKKKYYKVDYQGKMTNKRKEKSRSSTSKKYMPNRDRYLNTEEHLKYLVEKAINDILNVKGKRTLDEQLNANKRGDPFIDEIMQTRIPSHVKVPAIKYHGTTDPDDHLMAFNT